MVRSYIGKLKRGCANVSRDGTQDRLFLCLILFIFGSFFGSMASASALYEYRFSIGGTERALFESLFFLLLLVFSTSFLGVAAVPALLILKGFVSSACIASFFVFSGGNFVGAILLEAVPVFILMPVFFLLADDCIGLSSRLLELRFGIGRYHGGHKIYLHIFLCVLFISLTI